MMMTAVVGTAARWWLEFSPIRRASSFRASFHVGGWYFQPLYCHRRASLIYRTFHSVGEHFF